MTEQPDAAIQLAPDAPLQHDAAYAAFLLHHTTPATCSCILCCRSSFDTLHSHLAYHTKRIRSRLVHRLRSGHTTLPYIPHACLSIDASWSDWMRAVARSTWEVVRMRGEASDRRQRRPCEAAIQQLVNERRVDEEERLHCEPSQPFHPFQPPSAVSSAALCSHDNLTPFSPFSRSTISSPDPADRTPSLVPPISLPPNDAIESDSFSPFADNFPSVESPCFVIPTLSVRSSLCLYLQHRAFPPGSSVLLTAVTIPDMLTVLNHYQLVPIPIDINARTLSPSLDTLRTHRQPNTVALLVAHLYGRQMHMTALISEAHSIGLEVWEDIAEGFRGYKPNNSSNSMDDSSAANPYFASFPLGSPRSDLVLFSFGAIKQLTAFGGGLLILPNRHYRTAEALIELHHTLPIASNSAYWQKSMKIVLGMSVLNIPILSGLVMTSARMIGIDHKSLVVALLRGFPSNLMYNLNHQPSTALLHNLHDRLEKARISHLHTTVRGELFSALLPSDLVIPGFDSPSRHYWLFPILPPNHLTTAVFLRELNRLGVDAYRGATQLAVVRDGGCWEAEELMDRVVYLPVHAGVSLRYLVRMAAIVQIVVEGEADEVSAKPLRSAL